MANASNETAGGALVTRRRFFGCAAVAGGAALGGAALAAGGGMALMSWREKDGQPSQEAFKQLLSRAQESAPGKRFPVMDLHSHPSMKAYMFKQRFWKTHDAQPGFSPINMTVDIDALVRGGAGVFLCTAYVVERQMFSDIIPLRMLSTLHPRARHLATAPLDALAMEYLDQAEEMVAETRRQRGDIIEVAKGFSDMKRITGGGKICMVHAMEGDHHLCGNLDTVDTLFNRGVCMLTAPHLYPNESGGCVDIFGSWRQNWWAKGSFKKGYQDNSGLTPWGRELVEKLLDVGIIVDIIHGTQKYRSQVLEIARNHPKKRPVTMSHVDISGDYNKQMGPTPGDVRAIADTGGVVGLMMVQHYADTANTKSPVEAMLDAVDYLMKHGGEDVVAIGSDCDGFTNVPQGLASPRDFGSLRKALLGKYTEEQTAKLLFGNGERLLRLGWGKA